MLLSIGKPYLNLMLKIYKSPRLKTTMENIFKQPDIKFMLKKGLREIDRKWGHYCRYNEEVTRELAEADFLIDLRRITRNIQNHESRHGFFIKKTAKRKPHQIILAPKDLYPSGNHLRTAKKENTAKVSRTYQQPLDLEVMDAWKKINTGDILVGTDWQGHNYTDRSFRVFTNVDNIKAQILRRHLKKTGFQTNIADYSGNLTSRGATQINIHGIPSLSTNRVYTIHLRHVPVFKGKKPSQEIIQTSYDLCEYPPHYCGKPEWHNVKDSRSVMSIIEGQRTGEEKYLDMHFILGFKFVASDLKRKGFKVIDPFPEINHIKRLEYFFNQLPYVLVEDKKHGMTNRSHLDFVESEITLNWYLGSLNFLEGKKGKKR